MNALTFYWRYWKTFVRNKFKGPQLNTKKKQVKIYCGFSRVSELSQLHHSMCHRRYSPKHASGLTGIRPHDSIATLKPIPASKRDEQLVPNIATSLKFILQLHGREVTLRFYSDILAWLQASATKQMRTALFGTDRLSRNVCKKLPLLSAKWPRRARFSLSLSLSLSFSCETGGRAV